MISLRDDCGLWWPDYDLDPVKCLSFVQKGLTDSDVALSYCAKKRVCVQAGGHAGLWPARLAQSFKCVYTFECEPLLAECMRRNIAATPLRNVFISAKALGAHQGVVKMLPAVSAGSFRIDAERGTVDVEQTTIDAMQLKRCDAIFLDVEGYEVEALKGARETIERCSPVIMVEELPRSKAAIRAHLASIGYNVRKLVHSDAIYTR